MRGFITSNIAALAVVMVLPSVALAGDPAPSGAEREFAGLLNAERARQALPALATSPALTDVGDDYVAENVARGGITHDRDRPFTARAEQADVDDRPRKLRPPARVAAARNVSAHAKAIRARARTTDDPITASAWSS